MDIGGKVSAHDAITSLGEVLYEEMEEIENSDLEVFDLYTNVLKSKIYKHNANFLERLCCGYNTLVDELKKG